MKILIAFIIALFAATLVYGQEQDFTGEQEEAVQTTEPKARGFNSNIFKDLGSWDKWLYIGGGMGLGGGSFMLNQGLVFDAVITRFLSVEVMPSIALADRIYPVIPITARLGWRFARIDISADIGYTPLWGLNVGGTVGLNSNFNSAFFAKFVAMPLTNLYSFDTYKKTFMYGILGFKIGLINRQN